MTQTPTDALRLVPNMPTVELTDDMLFKIETGETVTWGELKRRQYEQAVRNFNTMREDGSLPAPASPLPGGGWQDISTFKESGQGNPVIVAVPTKEGGWIVGEAWKSVMEADDPYRGNDGWWWAGTSPGDAYNDPIRFMNHGDAEWWMPLPAAPTGEPK